MKINIEKKINDVFNYKEFSNGDLEPLKLPAYLLIKHNFSIKKPVKFFVWNNYICISNMFTEYFIVMIISLYK